VGGVGHEPLRVQEGVVQARDHAVERDRQALQLVSRGRDRESFSQVVLRDLLRLAGNLVHRPKGPADEDIPARRRQGRDNGQAKSKQQQQVVEHGLDRRGGGPDLDQVGGAAGSGADRCDQKRRSGGYRLLARELLQLRGRRSGHRRRIEGLADRDAGTVDEPAVAARDADKPVALLRVIERGDLPGDIGLARLAGVRHKRVGDLPGAARLGLQQRVLEVALDMEEEQRTQRDDDHGKQPGVPRGQAEADRPYGHSAGSSDRE
jgi:hypothetical protein